MALSKNKMQQLDDKLLEIALNDFERFCTITGADKTLAYICIEKARGKSNGEIATVLGTARQTIFKKGKRCKS